MSISGSVVVQSILGAAELVALLAVVARASYMLHLNVVLHVGCVLAGVVTFCALPSTRGVLEHLRPD